MFDNNVLFQNVGFCVFTVGLQIYIRIQDVPKKHRLCLVCCVEWKADYLSRRNSCTDPLSLGVVNHRSVPHDVNKPNMCSTSSSLHYKRG